MKSKKDNTTFPTWEKVYTDVKDTSFFEYIKGIQIKNEIYLFPSSIEKNPYNSRFYHFKSDTETMTFEEMPFPCFNPVFDKNNLIYLYKYDDSFSSDYRYSLVEFSLDNREFRVLSSSGTAPKKRTDDFNSFYHNEKIYFFGGFQIFPGDNTGSFIYSYCIRSNEWNLVKYSGNFPASVPCTPYLGNRGGMNGVTYYTKNIFLLGGKIVENNFPDFPNFTKPNFNYVETNDIYEFDLNSFKWEKKTLKGKNYTFYNHSCCLLRDGMIIFNKNNICYLDFLHMTITMKKTLLFTPEAKNQTVLFDRDISTIYLIGSMKDCDDCVVFKTSVQNIDQNAPNYNDEKDVGYDYMLNDKEFSDLKISVERKEILMNKKVYNNLFFPNKLNLQKIDDGIVINETSYVSFFNFLKIVYSNFTIDIGNYDTEIIKEIINYILRSKTSSYLKKIISSIKINPNNAVSLFQVGLNFNLTELRNKTEIFISENLNSITNITRDVMRLIMESYFCSHKLVISSKCSGFEFKNYSTKPIQMEKIQEIKEIFKDPKINFCLDCKRFLPDFQPPSNI